MLKWLEKQWLDDPEHMAAVVERAMRARWPSPPFSQLLRLNKTPASARALGLLHWRATEN